MLMNTFRSLFANGSAPAADLRKTAAVVERGKRIGGFVNDEAIGARNGAVEVGHYIFHAVDDELHALRELGVVALVGPIWKPRA